VRFYRSVKTYLFGVHGYVKKVVAPHACHEKNYPRSELLVRHLPQHKLTLVALTFDLFHVKHRLGVLGVATNRKPRF